MLVMTKIAFRFLGESEYFIFENFNYRKWVPKNKARTNLAYNFHTKKMDEFSPGIEVYAWRPQVIETKPFGGLKERIAVNKVLKKGER